MATSSKMAEMLELSAVTIKVATIEMLQWAVMNMPETNGKQSLNKEIEEIKKNKMKIVELKNTETKIKHSVEGINSRTGTTE